jgi:hypothetical protein
MHGHAGNVERKIRLWIVQQELNRRKSQQPAQIHARGEAPVGRRELVVNLRDRNP